MSHANVLIDARNLRVGGGVQVASSLVSEFTDLLRDEVVTSRYPWLRELRIEVSPEVAANVVDPDVLERLVVDPRRFGRRSTDVDLDLHFQVFGPLWGPRRAPRLLVGYADVTAVHRAFQRRLRERIRAELSLLSLHRADVVVVESSAFAKALSDALRRTQTIEVIPNSYHQIFDAPDDWVSLQLSRSGGELLFAYVTRPYAHKNLEILPDIGAGLRKAGLQTRFVVTLTPVEWETMSQRFRDNCLNVGKVPVSGLPSLYSQVDGVVFPSKLEAFSAGPLEAMKSGKVIFASDREFVRESCGPVPFYADPDDWRSWVDVISGALKDPAEVKRRVAAGQALVQRLPSARARAQGYVDLIDELLRGSDRCSS